MRLKKVNKFEEVFLKIFIIYRLGSMKKDKPLNLLFKDLSTQPYKLYFGVVVFSDLNESKDIYKMPFDLLRYGKTHLLHQYYFLSAKILTCLNGVVIHSRRKCISSKCSSMCTGCFNFIVFQ